MGKRIVVFLSIVLLAGVANAGSDNPLSWVRRAMVTMDGYGMRCLVVYTHGQTTNVVSCLPLRDITGCFTPQDYRSLDLNERSVDKEGRTWMDHMPHRASIKATKTERSARKKVTKKPVEKKAAAPRSRTKTAK